MNRGLYTAATGMSAAQRLLDVTANNLANVSTNAFKRDGITFRDALERNIASDGRQLGEISYGAVSDGEYTSFDMGSISTTGNPFDVAIKSQKGAFKVDIGNGNYRYTRDGAFRLNDQGQLCTRQGYLVMDDRDSPIQVEGQDVSIGNNGEVSVGKNVVATLAVYDGTFVKQGQNMFVSNDAQPMDSVNLQSQAIEGSNVNAVEAMVQMITLSRSFDMAQKSVQQHDELTQRLIQSLSGS